MATHCCVPQIPGTVVDNLRGRRFNLSSDCVIGSLSTLKILASVAVTVSIKIVGWIFFYYVVYIESHVTDKTVPVKRKSVLIIGLRHNLIIIDALVVILYQIFIKNRMQWCNYSFSL